MTHDRRVFCLVLAAAGAGCTAFAPPLPLPVLRLGPASLGASVALQQRIAVEVAGTTRELDAVLEVDPQALRLAVVALGQTVARIDWDGRTLQERHAPGWPEIASGERILSDLQLMLWPAEAIRAALPAGWTLGDTPGQRLLSARGQPVVRITRDAPARSTLENFRGRYRLRVDSRPLEPDAP